MHIVFVATARPGAGLAVRFLLREAKTLVRWKLLKKAPFGAVKRSFFLYVPGVDPHFCHLEA